MTDALKNIEIEKMAVAELMEIKKPLIFQYLTNIFPLALSLFPKGKKGGSGAGSIIVTKKRCLKTIKIY